MPLDSWFPEASVSTSSASGTAVSNRPHQSSNLHGTKRDTIASDSNRDSGAEDVTSTRHSPAALEDSCKAATVGQYEMCTVSEPMAPQLKACTDADAQETVFGARGRTVVAGGRRDDDAAHVNKPTSIYFLSDDDKPGSSPSHFLKTHSRASPTNEDCSYLGIPRLSQPETAIGIKIGHPHDPLEEPILTPPPTRHSKLERSPRRTESSSVLAVAKKIDSGDRPSDREHRPRDSRRRRHREYKKKTPLEMPSSSPPRSLVEHEGRVPVRETEHDLRESELQPPASLEERIHDKRDCKAATKEINPEPSRLSQNGVPALKRTHESGRRHRRPESPSRPPSATAELISTPSKACDTYKSSNEIENSLACRGVPQLLGTAVHQGSKFSAVTQNDTSKGSTDLSSPPPAGAAPPGPGIAMRAGKDFSIPLDAERSGRRKTGGGSSNVATSDDDGVASGTGFRGGSRKCRPPVCAESSVKTHRNGCGANTTALPNDATGQRSTSSHHHRASACSGLPATDQLSSRSSSDWSCPNDGATPATSRAAAEACGSPTFLATPTATRIGLKVSDQTASQFEMAAPAGFAPALQPSTVATQGRLSRGLLGTKAAASLPLQSHTESVAETTVVPWVGDGANGPAAVLSPSSVVAIGEDVEAAFLVGSAADAALRAREQPPMTRTMESTCDQAGRMVRVTQKQLRIVGGYRIQTRVEVLDLRLPHSPVIFSVKHSHGYPWGRQLTVQKNIMLACIIAGGAEPPIEISPDARTMFCRTASSQHLHSYIERVIPHVRRCEGTPTGVRLFWWRAVDNGAIVLLNETTGRMIFVLNRERSLPSAATTLGRALAVLRQLVLDNLQLSALASQVTNIDGSAAMASADPGFLPPTFLLRDPTYPSASDIKSIFPTGDDRRPISLHQVRDVVHQWALEHQVSPWLTKLILRIRGPRKCQISNYRYSLDVDSSDPSSLALQAHLNEPLSREMQAFPICMVPIALRGRSLGDTSLTFLQALWFLKKLFDFHRTTVAATALAPNQKGHSSIARQISGTPDSTRQLLSSNSVSQRRLYSSSTSAPAETSLIRQSSTVVPEPAAIFRAPRLGICVEPPRLFPAAQAATVPQARITSRGW